MDARTSGPIGSTNAMKEDEGNRSVTRINAPLLAITILLCSSPECRSEGPSAISPLLRVVDLDVGESAHVEMADGSKTSIKLVALDETVDSVCSAVRRAEVTVEVNGERGTLVSATYRRPKLIGGVLIDCPITSGYNRNGSPAFWGLDRDARVRLWPKDSPLLREGTFTYPAKQRWFASDTQMANERAFGLYLALGFRPEPHDLAVLEGQQQGRMALAGGVYRNRPADMAVEEHRGDLPPG